MWVCLRNIILCQHTEICRIWWNALEKRRMPSLPKWPIIQVRTLTIFTYYVWLTYFAIYRKILSQMAQLEIYQICKNLGWCLLFCGVMKVIGLWHNLILSVTQPWSRSQIGYLFLYILLPLLNVFCKHFTLLFSILLNCNIKFLMKKFPTISRKYKAGLSKIQQYNQ